MSRENSSGSPFLPLSLFLWNMKRHYPSRWTISGWRSHQPSAKPIYADVCHLGSWTSVGEPCRAKTPFSHRMSGDRWRRLSASWNDARPSWTSVEDGLANDRRNSERSFLLYRAIAGPTLSRINKTPAAKQWNDLWRRLTVPPATNENNKSKGQRNK